jgi:hypothetical protein
MLMRTLKAAIAAVCIGLLLLLGWHAVDWLRSPPEPLFGTLRQVSTALINYSVVHDRLPPAIVYSKEGQPLYSSRVLLLSDLDEDLFKEFHLDEPWDSPHNIALLPRMPPEYAPPRSKASKVPPYHTVIHVFVGKGAAFEGREGLRLPMDFPDGLSRTILIIEAGAPVPWTKPEDLPYDPYGPLPELPGLYPSGFRYCTADGSCRLIKRETTEATWRALITRNGRDKPDPGWDD